MKNTVFFSIIIPIYKVEKYLEECVNSVINQSFKEIEIILVDDGSPDLCPQICDRYEKEDDRIKVIHKRNEGLSEARNAGLKKSQGKYVIFLDSDDYYLNHNFLADVYGKIQYNSIDLVLYKRQKYIDETNLFKSPPSPYSDEILQKQDAEDVFYLLSKNDELEANASLKIIKRELLISNNLFFKRGMLSEDVEWFFRLAPLVKKVIVLNEVSYCYRIRKGSITHSINIKHIDDMMYIITYYAGQLKTIENEKLKKALLNYLAYQYYITIGLAWTYSGEHKKEYIDKLFEYSWLTQYSISRKTKISANLVKYLRRLSPIVLGKYVKRKG